MPIVRTFGCPECNHVWEATLTAEQWDDPPPNCPRCIAYDFEHQAQQIFRPVAVKGAAGNARDTANRMAEQIAAEDYHVANMNRDRHEGATPKVSYNPINFKGQRIVDNRPANPNASAPSNWGASSEALETAVALGRQTRIQFGNGLDVLQSALKSGDQPDLIAASKRKSARIW